MRDSFTLLLICLGIAVILGLFFYYVHRKLYRVKKDIKSLQTHVFYQQKIIEQQDRTLSEKLGVPSNIRESSSIPFPVDLGTPTSVSHDPPTNTLNSTGTNPANPLFPMMSAALPIAPMMGSLLTMFQQIQTDPEMDINQDEYIQIPSVSKDEIDQELRQELEELKEPVLPLESPVKDPHPIQKDPSGEKDNPPLLSQKTKNSSSETTVATST